MDGYFLKSHKSLSPATMPSAFAAIPFFVKAFLWWQQKQLEDRLPADDNQNIPLNATFGF
jgi:hypothetical protein